MSIEDFQEVVDQLDPADLPEAARIVVRALPDDDALLRHRSWAATEEPDRRKAEKARAEGGADTIRQLRAAGTLAAPEPVEPVEGLPEHSVWTPGVIFLPGEMATTDGSKTVWQVVADSPTTTQPGGTEWEQVWPVPEPATEEE